MLFDIFLPNMPNIIDDDNYLNTYSYLHTSLDDFVENLEQQIITNNDLLVNAAVAVANALRNAN